MPQEIKVGTIMSSGWPPIPEVLAIEHGAHPGAWTKVTVADGFVLDRQIHEAGWNFFFMAAEVKALFVGASGNDKIDGALKRILGKVDQQHFNGLEVTSIVAKHFLGVPYTVVTAHSRHIQKSCCLETLEARSALAATKNGHPVERVA
jgi:hypothetical protein